jgi:hypothetical protein
MEKRGGSAAATAHDHDHEGHDHGAHEDPGPPA